MTKNITKPYPKLRVYFKNSPTSDKGVEYDGPLEYEKILHWVSRTLDFDLPETEMFPKKLFPERWLKRRTLYHGSIAVLEDWNFKNEIEDFLTEQHWFILFYHRKMSTETNGVLRDFHILAKQYRDDPARKFGKVHTQDIDCFDTIKKYKIPFGQNMILAFIQPYVSSTSEKIHAKKIIRHYANFGQNYWYWMDDWMISQIASIWYPDTHTDVVELTEENWAKHINGVQDFNMDVGYFISKNPYTWAVLIHDNSKESKELVKMWKELALKLKGTAKLGTMNVYKNTARRRWVKARKVPMIRILNT